MMKDIKSKKINLDELVWTIIIWINQYELIIYLSIFLVFFSNSWLSTADLPPYSDRKPAMFSFSLVRPGFSALLVTCSLTPYYSLNLYFTCVLRLVQRSYRYCPSLNLSPFLSSALSTLVLGATSLFSVLKELFHQSWGQILSNSCSFSISSFLFP